MPPPPPKEITVYRRIEKINAIALALSEWVEGVEYRRYNVPTTDHGVVPVTLRYAAEPRIAILDWNSDLAADTIAFWVNDLGRTRMVSIDHDYGHYENLKQALQAVLPRNAVRVPCCPWCGSLEYTADNDPCMPCCAGEKGVDW